MGKSNSKHDIALLNSSGTEIGFTLVRGKGNIPVYEEITDKPLADQYYAGDPLYKYMNPEKEIAIAQDDFRGGFGLEYQHRDYPKKYYYGINYDAKEGLLVGLPTTVTGLTVTALTITNANMETAATGWTGGQRDNAQAHTGTYSWKVYIGGGNATQDIASGTDYKGRIYTFSCWVWHNVGSQARIAIADGVGTTNSSWHTGSGWEQLSVTRTINASATSLTLTLDGNAAASGAWFDDATLVQPVAGAVNAQVDFGGEHYLSYGNILMKLNGTGTAYTYVYNFPTTITDLYIFSVSGTDYLFICIGWSNEYWYTSNGITFTESNLSINAKFMTASGVTLYCADTNSTIQQATNPLNGGAWGTSKQMGEDAYDIASLATFGGLIYANKTDCKVYYVDSSGNVQALVSASANLAGTNTTRMFAWREESLLIPYGAQDLLLYDGTTVYNISPTLSANGVSDFAGQVQAIAGDAQWLYIVLDNSTKIETMKGRWEEVDGETDWRWHTLNEITLTNCSSAQISSIYKKRLWIGSDTYTECVYYVPVTAKYGGITGDTNYTYQTGGYLVTPWFHADFPAEKKAWIKLTLKMASTTANIYYEAHYKKLGDASWTEIDSTNKFKTSPATTRYIPVDGSSNNPTSEYFSLKIVGVTNSTATSPRLLGYDLRGVWYPTIRKIIHFQCILEDNVPLLDGTVDDVLASTLKSTIDGANSSNYPRGFYPVDWSSSADTVYVKLLTPLRKVKTYDERLHRDAWACDVNLLVVPLA